LTLPHMLHAPPILSSISSSYYLVKCFGMKRLTMQFSSVSCNFIPWMSQYSSQRPELRHPKHICSSLNERGHVSHPHKRTVSIIVLIFMSFDIRRKDWLDFELNGSKILQI
jgi:hypothetical protein